MNAHQAIVSRWLTSIGNELGHTLSLGEDGHCILFCGDDLRCTVEVPDGEETETVYVYMPMMRLPDDESAQLKLAKGALEINMFGLATGGSNLSLDSRSQSIVLTFAAGLEILEEDVFKQMLSDFLDIGVDVYEQLKKVTDFQTPQEIDNTPAAHAIRV